MDNISEVDSNFITVQKMAFIYNALEKGWKVEKYQEKYIFTKMVEPLNSPGFGTMRIFDSIAGPSPSDRMSAFNLSNSQSVFTRDRQEEVRNAPNQILSYSMMDSYSPDYVVTENFLTKIEFLSEFNTDDESENVSMPIWEPLTIDTYKENTGKKPVKKINVSTKPLILKYLPID